MINSKPVSIFDFGFAIASVNAVTTKSKLANQKSKIHFKRSGRFRFVFAAAAFCRQRAISS